jgi:hypothetical protein
VCLDSARQAVSPIVAVTALLLVVGASSGGLMVASPERPAQRERRIDRWRKFGDGARDQDAQGGHPRPPPTPVVRSVTWAGDGQERQRGHGQGDVPEPGQVLADPVGAQPDFTLAYSKAPRPTSGSLPPGPG